MTKHYFPLTYSKFIHSISKYFNLIYTYIYSKYDLYNFIYVFIFYVWLSWIPALHRKNKLVIRLSNFTWTVAYILWSFEIISVWNMKFLQFVYNIHISTNIIWDVSGLKWGCIWLQYWTIVIIRVIWNYNFLFLISIYIWLSYDCWFSGIKIWIIHILRQPIQFLNLSFFKSSWNTSLDNFIR